VALLTGLNSLVDVELELIVFQLSDFFAEKVRVLLLDVEFRLRNSFLHMKRYLILTHETAITRIFSIDCQLIWLLY